MIHEFALHLSLTNSMVQAITVVVHSEGSKFKNTPKMD